MNILAFDTSGPVGSVVVARDGSVSARATMRRQREHASALVPTIEATVAEAGLVRGDVGAIVVGEGPGSFTGVRVAAATAKGLGRALDVPVYAVSSLAAAALAAAGPPIRYALFDARGERVYGACYGLGARALTELVPVHAGELRDVVADEVPAGAVFVGDGADKHRASIEGAGFEVSPFLDGVTLADGLVRWLELGDAVAVADLGAWEPEYVRASSAERLWIP